jgi:NAD(P)-dependent dehydrogenase (short-subunit alcohol dehydrogenase family)
MTTVAITGSASGIGAATAARLAAAGTRVIGVDLREADVEADLSTAEGRAAAVSGVSERCDGRLDGLLLAAGVSGTLQSPDLVTRINYFGVVDVMDALLPALAKGDAPSCVVMSSDSCKHDDWSEMPYVAALLEHDEDRAVQLAIDAKHSFLAYGPGKWALGAAVRWRASEWGERGVRLNAVAPGPTDTPMLDEVRSKFAEVVEGLPIPLGRFGRPEEIASVIAFLLGPESSYVHGTVLFADGGGDALRNDAKF